MDNKREEFIDLLNKIRESTPFFTQQDFDELYNQINEIKAIKKLNSFYDWWDKYGELGVNG